MECDARAVSFLCIQPMLRLLARTVTKTFHKPATDTSPKQHPVGRQATPNPAPAACAAPPATDAAPVDEPAANQEAVERDATPADNTAPEETAAADTAVAAGAPDTARDAAPGDPARGDEAADPTAPAPEADQPEPENQEPKERCLAVLDPHSNPEATLQ